MFRKRSPFFKRVKLAFHLIGQQDYVLLTQTVQAVGVRGIVMPLFDEKCDIARETIKEGTKQLLAEATLEDQLLFREYEKAASKMSALIREELRGKYRG